MNNGSPLFILAGNGPYENRGCEAIVRGTVRILRHHFGAPRFVVCSHYHDRDGVSKQQAQETDTDIVHERIRHCYKRFDFLWFMTNVLKRTFPAGLKHMFYKDLKPHLSPAQAVLAVGGDNYSLDYSGRPIVCTALDDLVISRVKPLVIWGASVGPFACDPAYEKYIIEHFRKVHIFARESLTVDYLNGRGLVENVYRVADPAFLLEPTEPAREKLDIPFHEGAIGVNISPLMARFAGVETLDGWTAKSASIVESIIRKTGRSIYLIPHVSGSKASHKDHAFLCKVAGLLNGKKAQVFVVPDSLDAAETKGVISKMDLFVGARTHSTIASLSSYVPTLSLGYSMKSRGINHDVYGHTNYCLHGENIRADIVTDKVSQMLSNRRSIIEQLKASIPRTRGNALNAGAILKRIMSV
ncbi:MAG: polysaccharide pyruvyl transferase family protein [Planctomycetota bacterium]